MITEHARELRRRRALERTRRRRLVAIVAVASLALTGLVWRGSADEAVDAVPAAAAGARDRPAEAAAGRPAPTAHRSIYAHTGVGTLSPSTRDDRERIYVPNSESDTVSVIDPRRERVVDSFPVGDLPHHVTPSRDLGTFYVNNTQGNSLTPLDPRTGRPKGRPIPVDDPYNLYFTPDGRSAIVVAERLQRLDFRDPKTWRLQKSVRVGCLGVDHMDFTADGSRAVASCEFDGTLLLVDVAKRRIVERLDLAHVAAKPVDVRLSPDGRLFYVADEVANGVWKVDAERFEVKDFIETGPGTHGLYPSRDARVMYATNRTGGTVSVIDMDRGRVTDTWRIPGGARPDMGSRSGRAPTGCDQHSFT